MFMARFPIIYHSVLIVLMLVEIIQLSALVYTHHYYKLGTIYRLRLSKLSSQIRFGGNQPRIQLVILYLRQKIGVSFKTTTTEYCY